MIIVETESSPQATESAEPSAKKRKTKSPVVEDPSPKKRRVTTNVSSDDDICIVENNSDVQIVSGPGCHVVDKNSSVKRVRQSVDDDCQIVFDDGDADKASPTKKVKQVTY